MAVAEARRGKAPEGHDVSRAFNNNGDPPSATLDLSETGPV